MTFCSQLVPGSVAKLLVLSPKHGQDFLDTCDCLNLRYYRRSGWIFLALLMTRFLCLMHNKYISKMYRLYFGLFFERFSQWGKCVKIYAFETREAFLEAPCTRKYLFPGQKYAGSIISSFMLCVRCCIELLPINVGEKVTLNWICEQN